LEHKPEHEAPKVNSKELLKRVMTHLTNRRLVLGFNKWNGWVENCKTSEGADRIKLILSRRDNGKRNSEDIKTISGWIKKLPAFVNLKRTEIEVMAQVRSD
jgi:hypothetical protein